MKMPNFWLISMGLFKMTVFKSRVMGEPNSRIDVARLTGIYFRPLYHVMTYPRRRADAIRVRVHCSELSVCM